MLSEALRLIRTYHGLKQFQLAEKLGVSNSHLSEIETGVKKPSLDLLEKYSTVLDMPLSSILFFAEELPEVGTGKKVRQRVANRVIKILQFIEARANEEAKHEEIQD